MLPVPSSLTLISSAVGIVVFQFTGAAGVDHYDVYRSSAPGQVGAKINVNPIPEPVSPYITNFSDDGINSIQAPVAPGVYFYRVVACDNAGNISLPSDVLGISVDLPQQITPPQAEISSVTSLGN